MQYVSAGAIGPPALGEKGSCDFTTVIMTVAKHIFSKMAHRTFLKLLMKLGCLKGKKLTTLDFPWEKTHFGDNVQKYPKNSFLDFTKTLVH